MVQFRGFAAWALGLKIQATGGQLPDLFGDRVKNREKFWGKRLAWPESAAIGQVKKFFSRAHHIFPQASSPKPQVPSPWPMPQCLQPVVLPYILFSGGKNDLDTRHLGFLS
ncbi:MAG TPA: hypothetical protein VM658_10170 [bacterium]|nr:hypothetical protein [bacterium]